MRLIDADKIQWKSYPNDYGETNDDYVEKCDIDNMPTVDAVVVTRCKDCKHKGWVQEPCHGKSVDYCRVWDCTLRDLESTFCSYGERKDGGTE